MNSLFQTMKKSLLFLATNTKNEDELFDYINSTFKDKITTWEYFVNWHKVFTNVNSIEKELNILNYLIGKDNLESELFALIKQYPEIIATFPALIALRDNSVDILVDSTKFIYKNYNFKVRKLSDPDIKDLTEFIIKSGIGEILSNKRIKNLVDYVTGVEVGLDSNGRKNRGGTLMEEIVEVYIKDVCKRNHLEYLAQANASKIQAKWDIKIQVDKSSRNIDFVIKKDNKLFFIEVNFYGGGGSKLKSTATEYHSMHGYWKNQKIEFIWITDGNGWQTTLKPLREYFDKADYLLNLDMLEKGILEKIINE